ncbi:MAG: ABC transporter ATP-binding protein [bacterium]|nr:ABC transporter ATP-binding protein [bacterium]
MALDPPVPLLSVQDVSKSFEGTTVIEECSLEVGWGEMVSLLGPSGCGKTTLLRIIAGLERADQGTIHISGTQVAGNGTWVRPEDRNVGMVFQDWALFPHLDVARNVGYGVPRSKRAAEVSNTLELVNLPGMQDRMPETLSGGQQQRVALARALAPQPTALLLDEPFSNLDSALRREVRTEVRRLLQATGMTAVFVTHDREEALVLGDRVAVMDAGRIMQIGSPAEIYQEPANPWVASFIGDVSMYPAEADGAVAHADFGSIPLIEACRGPVDVAVRPEDVDLRSDDSGTAIHTVDDFEFQGADSMVTVANPAGIRLLARVKGTQSLSPGDRVCPAYTGSPAAAFPRPDPD